MKKKSFILFTLLFCTMQLMAQSFSIVNSDNKTIYYNIISTANRTVEVTNSTGGFDTGANSYSDTIAIPDSVIHNDTTYAVTTIGEKAFFNCPALAHITLPNTTKTIKKRAFIDCTALTEITFPINLDTVCDSAFMGNTNLQTIHWNATRIHYFGYYRTFYNSYSKPIINSPIQTIVFNDNVLEIPDYACYEFYSLDSLKLSSNLSKIGKWAFLDCNRLDSITLPETLTYIGKYAFRSCDSLSYIYLPNSITNLEEYTFVDCISLKSATIPNTINTLHNGIFKGCTSLQHITIPNSVHRIEYSVFSNCSSLQEINLPDSIVGILRYAFEGCTLLTKFTLPTTLEELEEAFGNNPNLHTVYWNTPNIAENMFGHYDYWTSQIEYPFHDTPIETIIFGESVQSIPANAFIECTTLDTVIIGSNVTTIGDRSFTDCTNLAYLRIETPTPPTISNSVFVRVNNATPIYVSCLSHNLYATAPNWTRFTNIQTYNICNQISVASNNNDWGSVTGGGIYLQDSTATLEAIASANYHFVNWNDGNTENPRNIIVTQDSFFIANFALDQYQITCTPNNDAWGTITGAHAYAHNEIAILHAIPSEGHRFLNWNDGSTENPRSVIVISDSSFTANFAINQYQVSLSSSNNTWGSVSGSNTYNYGDTAQLQAYPQTGYHFTYWSDNNTDNPRALIVKCDTNLTANFAINQYRLTATSNNNAWGSVAGSNVYDHGTIATIQATASDNYHFVNWNDGSTENPRQIVMTQDTIIVANFASSQYQINVTSNNDTWGSVSGSNTYLLGSTATLQATPKEHYHFSQWNDFNIENPRSIVVTQDSSFIAIFAINQYQITVVSNNNIWGTVTGGGTYEYNSTATLHAIAQNGYQFINWNDGETTNPRTIPVIGNATYVANFEKIHDEGINDNTSNLNLTIYPNPTHSILHIDCDEPTTIAIYNTIGKCIARFKNQSTIDLSNLEAGQYTLKIQTDKGFTIHKVIKN